MLIAGGTKETGRMMLDMVVDMRNTLIITFISESSFKAKLRVMVSISGLMEKNSMDSGSRVWDKERAYGEVH
jgi:hypothetical protein